MFYHLLPVWEMRKLYSCSLKMELTLELKIIWVCAVWPSELHMVDLDALNQTVICACTYFSLITNSRGM